MEAAARRDQHAGLLIVGRSSIKLSLRTPPSAHKVYREKTSPLPRRLRQQSGGGHGGPRGVGSVRAGTPEPAPSHLLAPRSRLPARRGARRGPSDAAPSNLAHLGGLLRLILYAARAGALA